MPVVSRFILFNDCRVFSINLDEFDLQYILYVYILVSNYSDIEFSGIRFIALCNTIGMLVLQYAILSYVKLVYFSPQC